MDKRIPVIGKHGVNTLGVNLCNNVDAIDSVIVIVNWKNNTTTVDWSSMSYETLTWSAFRLNSEINREINSV